MGVVDTFGTYLFFPFLLVTTEELQHFINFSDWANFKTCGTRLAKTCGKKFCFHNCSLKLHETKTIFAFCLVFMAKSQSLGHIYLVVKHRQNPWTCTNIHFQWSSSSSKPGSPEVILSIMGKREMAKKSICMGENFHVEHVCIPSCNSSNVI